MNLEELRKVRLAVLCGGRSPEREVSLASGSNAYHALEQRGYNVKLYDLDEAFYKDALEKKFDAVFILLHGSPGEDGTVQGFLEMIGIPYVGSEVAASSIGMDKILSKAIFTANGIPVARYDTFCLANRHYQYVSSKSLTGRYSLDIDELLENLGDHLPVVVKPARLGSSVGVSIARSLSELRNGIKEAAKYDCCLVVEEFLKAREIQCGVIGRKNPFALPLIEIVTKTGFFDYKSKYTPGEADEISPAPLDKELTRKGQELALRTFKVLGCRDFARVDMFLLEDGSYVVSEVNTIPGMTSNSLVPKEAAAIGLSYSTLVEMIVLPALKEAFLRKKAWQD
ncbi:MAG: D-alanine--D-alanine ligase [Actinobacteria bacterium]|nr:D-alanine--D-alanine ligase [Actinomycetota bacterium]